MKIFDFFNIRHPGQNLPLARNTLDIARQNVNAAKCLYQNGYYPEAVFFLQQSVEKGIKAYGFYSGVIDEKFARKYISHQGSMFYSHAAHNYKKRFENMRDNFHLVNFVELVSRLNIPCFSEYFQKMDYVIEKIDDLNAKKGRILNPSEYLSEFTMIDKNQDAADSVNQILQNRETLQPFILQFREQSKQEKKRLLHTLKFYIYDFRARFQLCGRFGEMVKETTDDQVRQFFTYMYIELYSLSSLLGLAIITQGHEQASRYPDSQTNFTPLNYYSKDLQLIKDFPRLCEITEKNLELLGRLFTEFGEGWNPS